MTVKHYGTSGPLLVLLHGGPGAAGYMAPVARQLADSFRILEPYQRGSGQMALTVARHVADLHDLLETRAADGRPALLGHSWGAMLALAYAAAHPERVSALVLVGCGTFDQAARDRMRTILDGRLDAGVRARLERLPQDIVDPDERLRIAGDLLLPFYSYDLVSDGREIAACDALAHRQSWDDMVRLQEAGVYPAAFAAIGVPVLMLHGAADPHPGQMIRASLEPYLPQLEYQEWTRCGHYPWLETAVRDEFFARVRSWLIKYEV